MTSATSDYLKELAQERLQRAAMMQCHAALKQSDLKEVAELFEKVGKSPNAKAESNDFWQNRFQEFLNHEMTAHSSRMKMGNDNKDLREGYEKQEIWRARYNLWGIVDERLDEVFRDMDSTVAEVVKSLHQKRNDIFKQVCADLASIGTTIPDEPVSIRSSELESEKDETDSPKASPKAQGGIAAFAQARRRASHETASNYEASVAGTHLTLASSPSASNRMQTLSPHFKGVYDDGTSEDGDTHKDSGSPVHNDHFMAPASHPYTLEASKTASMIYGTANTFMRGGPAMLGAGPQDYSIRKPEPLSTQSYTSLHNTRITKKKSWHAGPDHCGAPVTRPGKDLSLRQLRDVMTNVYDSKAELDQQCRDRNEPTTTLEQHLYAFLGERYELKSAVKEWAAVIFIAVQKYSPTESDVAVFGKVLQNTLAESFPTVQETLKQTVHQLLLDQLTNAYPTLPHSETNAIFQGRIRSGFPITECAEVIKYMYNDGDADKLLVKLQDASVQAHKHSANVVTPVSADCVRLKDFVQVLLAFQMSLTESFLKEFVEMFKEIDMDNDGILKYSELQELTRHIAYIEDLEESSGASAVLMEAQNNTLATLRTYKKGATFTECVDMFTSLISARWGALNPA